jgi:hypothetical protein
MISDYMPARILPAWNLRDALAWEGRRTLGSGFIGVALVMLAMADDNITSSTWYWAWAVFGLGVVGAGWKWPGWLTAAAVGVVLASAYLAVLTSVLIGPGWWWISASIAIILTPLAALAFVRVDEGLLWGISGAALANGLIMGWEWTEGVRRPSGLIPSPNSAAGLLAISFLWLTWKRWYAPAILSLLILPFSGSRLAVLSLAIVIGILCVKGHWRFLLVASVAFVLALPFLDSILEQMRRADGYTMTLTERVIWNRPVNGLGHGYGSVEGWLPHNVPMRIVDEFGIPALLAWAVLVWLALRRKAGIWWYLMVFVVLVGMLDTYFWVGSVAGMFWAVVSGGQPQRDCKYQHPELY